MGQRRAMGLTLRRYRTAWETMAKNLWVLGLVAVLSVLVFLLAQLLAGNALYGLPLLLPLILLSVSGNRRVGLNVLTAVGMVLVYGALDLLVNAGSPRIPFVFLLLTAVSMAATAILAGRQNARMLDQERRYSEQSAMDALISEINTHLLRAATAEELCTLTLHHLYNVSGCAGTFYIADEHGMLCHVESYPKGLLLYPPEAAAAEAAYRQGERTGFGTRQFPNSSFYYLPLVSGDTALGVVGILGNPNAPLDARMLGILSKMLVRVAVVLEKQKLAVRHQRALLEKELEHMRSDFLRAISHDFRTPLTGIIGACSALGGEDMGLDANARKGLIDGIGEEAQWLLRMVENLLSVTRMEGGGPALSRSLEPVEEVLSSTMEKAQARFPHIDLRVTQPEGLLLVQMDPLLIMQVLMNLIENAVKYAPDAARIDLAVEAHPDAIAFTVRDYGPGIPQGDPQALFTPAAVRVGDARNGMGMGLSICRSVIRAHGGEIMAERREGGGSAFSFTLPREG